MPIKIKSSGGGSVSIDIPNTGTDYTLTAPARTGNIITSTDANTVTQAMIQTGFAGNGPAFSVYRSSNQNVSQSNWTKVNFNTKEFDTASAFDNTTNYRFQPTVAGYYQLTAGILFDVAVNGYNYMGFWKNGSVYRYSASNNSNQAGDITLNSSVLVYMNGSTDYMEVWAYSGATSPYFGGGITRSFFSGYLARSA